MSFIPDPEIELLDYISKQSEQILSIMEKNNVILNKILEKAEFFESALTEAKSEISLEKEE